MFLLRPRIYQNLIYKYYHKLVQIWLEYLIHQIHKSCWGIHEPKWHHQELAVTISGSEGCLLNVIFLNLQRVITRLKIYLGEELRSFDLIKQVINPWQRLLILDGRRSTIVITLLSRSLLG